MMENLISTYLYKNQYCPLPGIGTLTIVHESAQLKSDEQIMLAPKQNIVLQPFETDPEHFIQFISRRSNKSLESAKSELLGFCASLTDLDTFSKWQLTATGQFYVNELGQLQFKQEEIPDEFNPPVAIKRVIHPSAVHRIRVGDQEKGSDEMKEELQQNKNKKKSKAWMIWLFVLLILSGAVFAGLWYADEITLKTGIEIPFRIR
ncbi:MAG: hypothetical protein RIR96_293 [Bacteroidota bacterium]